MARVSPKASTAESSPMLLYGNRASGHSYKVRSYLLLAGIEHDYCDVDLDVPRAQRPTDFLRASRYGEVPTLVVDGVAHCQSNAILLTLAERYGHFAGTPAERQTVLEWLCWEMNRIGFSVPNLRHALRWEPVPPEVRGYLERRARADLARLDETLADREFLLASGLTIADLSCSGYLYWSHEAGLSLEPWPHVRRWLASIARTPGFLHPDVAMRSAPPVEA